MNTYLFDFDGTLVDSMPTYGSVMVRLLDENNIPYCDDILKIITPLGYKGTAEYFKTLGIGLSVEEMLHQMAENMIFEYTNNIAAKKNVAFALNALREKGASLNVLTASPHITLDPCLKRLGLYDLFDNVWSCDDFNTTKADPRIYKMAAERLGKCVDEIIFLDDNLNAVKTAKTVGMIAYGVYDHSSEEYTEEIKQATDRYISDFSELI